MYTILLATYNGAQYLEELLESVKDQSLAEWEMIIADDGSNDGTLDIIRQFSKKVSQNIEIIENKPSYKSARGNFAALIKRADDEGCEYVLCADQDDVWKKDKLYVLSQKMKKAEEKYTKSVPLLIHSDLEVVDSELNCINKSFFEYSMLVKKPGINKIIVQNNVTGCTMLMNKALIHAIADNVDNADVIMHDYWCNLYAAVFGKVIFADTATVEYRQHESNSVGAKAGKNIFYLINRLKKGRLDYKNQMKLSMKQCECFVQYFNDNKDYRVNNKEYVEGAMRIISEYSDICNRNKLYRIHFYLKNGVLKNGKVRKLMQIIWG